MNSRKYLARIVLLMTGVVWMFILISPNAHASEVRIEDSALEQKIRKTIGNFNEPLTEQDMRDLTFLVAQNAEVKSLQGLEYAVNLESLALTTNKIIDIKPISGLSNLKELYINDNLLTDLEPLAGLTQLEIIYADQNQVQDLTPLKNLSELQQLSLLNNKISSLDPLKDLRKLEYLGIVDNQIKDFDAITGITSLTSIAFSNNQISDISPLLKLPNLTSLALSDNAIDFKADGNKKAWQVLQDRGVELYGDSDDQRVEPAEPEPAITKVELPAKYTFPLAFTRATKDDIRHIATNNKGTILTISWDYLNLTYDYGKKWEARKLPRDANYNLLYSKDLYYLAVSDYKGTENYVTKDGKTWTSFQLHAPNGSKLSISSVDWVNGKRVLLATNEVLKHTYVFTSADGYKWEYKSEIATKGAYIIWNGKSYTALGGGYLYYGKASTKNQFSVQPSEGISGELIIFTSSDLQKWTQHSGAVKKLTYTWSDGNGPYKGFYVFLQEPVVNGRIQLADSYSHILTSTDGISFTMKKDQTALATNDWRSPIYEKSGKYYVFMHYWVSPGVVNTKLLTSADKIHWKTTKIKALNNMVVVQAGSQFMGHSGDAIMISGDGVNWQKIK